jgi:hypothetical protein
MIVGFACTTDAAGWVEAVLDVGSPSVNLLEAARGAPLDLRLERGGCLRRFFERALSRADTAAAGIVWDGSSKSVHI